eukprot:2356403-Pyramimonas_sp.AAC.1
MQDESRTAAASAPDSKWPYPPDARTLYEPPESLVRHGGPCSRQRRKRPGRRWRTQDVTSCGSNERVKLGVGPPPLEDAPGKGLGGCFADSAAL